MWWGLGGVVVSVVSRGILEKILMTYCVGDKGVKQEVERDLKKIIGLRCLCWGVL